MARRATVDTYAEPVKGFPPGSAIPQASARLNILDSALTAWLAVTGIFIRR